MSNQDITPILREWIRDDVPVGIKMMMTPELLDKLAARIYASRSSEKQWVAELAPNSDPDWPEAKEMDSNVYYVLCPDGVRRSVVAVDEDDAIVTIKDIVANNITTRVV